MALGIKSRAEKYVKTVPAVQLPAPIASFVCKSAK